MISGENGILKQVKNAQEKTQSSSIKEERQLTQILASMNTTIRQKFLPYMEKSSAIPMKTAN